MAFGTLIRNHPARVAALALRDAERTLDRTRLGPVHGWTARTSHGFAPRLQADEREDEYVITAELPGVDGADLDVTVEDGVLTLAGVRKGEGWSEDLSDEEKAKHSVSFTRRVRFNGEIDEPTVSARYRNGLLTVTVPKPKAPEPVVQTIPIEVA
jgi:HSP20 family protein